MKDGSENDSLRGEYVFFQVLIFLSLSSSLFTPSSRYSMYQLETIKGKPCTGLEHLSPRDPEEKGKGPNRGRKTNPVRVDTFIPEISITEVKNGCEFFNPSYYLTATGLCQIFDTSAPAEPEGKYVSE